MRLGRILPVICLLLLLSGCGTKGVKAPLPIDTDNGAVAESPTPAPTGALTPAPTESADPTPLVTEAANPATPTPKTTGEDISNTAAPTPAGITEGGLRALYESEDMPVVSITPYNGDFLVQYGEVAWGFDWVYGKTGERHRIMFCEEGVRDVEILEPGRVRVLTDGFYREAGYRSFPSVRLGYAATELDENGEPLPYEREKGNSSREKYWADIKEPSAFGRIARREVVTNALVDATGAQFVFGPPADLKGLSSFFAATTTPPATEISFDEEARGMTLIFRDTLLSSGDIPEFSDEQEERLYLDWLRATEITLPTEFPAGELYGSNPYISRATIEESGDDTVVKLYLTEKAEEYTVEISKTGPGDNGPYIRLILRGERW